MSGGQPTGAGGARRTRTLAVAAAIGVIAVVVVSQLRLADDPGPSLAGGPPTGRIAYLGAQGSHRGLFALDAATGRDHADHRRGRVRPVGGWSPDGSQVAYILEEPGPRYAVVVARADGSDPLTIFEQEDTGAVGPDVIDVSWSPDGTEDRPLRQDRGGRCGTADDPDHRCRRSEEIRGARGTLDVGRLVTRRPATPGAWLPARTKAVRPVHGPPRRLGPRSS